MTILVDMDDVIENLGAAWVEYLNTRYGTNVAREDVREWEVSKFFPELTPEQVYGALQEEALWEVVRPLPGAIDGLKKLIADRHDVYIVTSSYYKTVRAKFDLVLIRYFPFIRMDKVIIAANKQMIRGDVLIDDAPHNLIGGAYEKILMDAPHNRDFDETEIGAYRAYGWDDVLDFVKVIDINKTFF